MRLKFMKKNVISVPKLKTCARVARSPPDKRTMADMTTETRMTEINGTPAPETLLRDGGRRFCRAIANKAREPPKILAMTTEAVAKSAAIDMYPRISGFCVATIRALSRGASEVASTDQFTRPTATIETAT